MMKLKIKFILITISHFRGGKICLTDHFKPLWARNVPKFGIAHAMALGVSMTFHNFFSYLFELPFFFKKKNKT